MMMHPRIKGLLKNLALALGTFLFCFLLLEITIRFMGYGNVEIYEADPLLYWRNKPNQNCRTTVERKPVHINSQGTRGPEFAIPKPANTLRILTLGDSITFGWGLSEPETYSGLLEKHLQEALGPRKKVEVLNGGVNSWSYAQMYAFLRDRALAYQPDFVILGEANLWTQFSEKNSPDFVQKFLWRIRFKNFLRRFAIYHYFIEVRMRNFYTKFRSKFIPINPQNDTFFKEQQQKDPEAFFRQAMENICQLAQSKGIKPILLFIPTVNDLSPTNQPITLRLKQTVSQKSNVPLLDLRADMRAGGKAYYLEGDPVHPNAEGDRVIAQRLFETVNKMLSP
ncbi:MAG: SGNH/GDSL hydrolase family protein [Chloroflexi bacterium]|nr:SGNH/GDSL hydrolase family protein [Chloroflexota bacterium]